MQQIKTLLISLLILTIIYYTFFYIFLFFGAIIIFVITVTYLIKYYYYKSIKIIKKDKLIFEKLIKENNIQNIEKYIKKQNNFIIRKILKKIILTTIERQNNKNKYTNKELKKALNIFNYKESDLHFLEKKVLNKKYKELAKLYHPDISKNVDLSMSEINNARDILLTIIKK